MKIAPLTYWLWLYVSVTGVVIYYLLYHLWRGIAAKQRCTKKPRLPGALA